MQKFSFLMYNFQEKEMLLVKKKTCVLLENKELQTFIQGTKKSFET
jgi:hypothetical protein